MREIDGRRGTEEKSGAQFVGMAMSVTTTGSAWPLVACCAGAARHVHQ